MVENKQLVAMRYRNNNIGATSIDWYIGKRCNFDCSYCVDYLHDNSSPHVPLDNMKKLVDFVYERNKSNVYWSLTGGEPTLNPHFIELCQYIKSRGALNVSITTNGSRSLKYFKQLYEFLDNITLSLHFESIEKKIDEYIDKIIQLEAWRKEWNEEQNKRDGFPDYSIGYQEKSLLVRFMVYPETLKTIEYMNSKFQDAGVEKIEYRYIRPLSGGSNEQMPSKKLDYTANHDTEKNPSLLHRFGVEVKSRVTKAYLKAKYPEFKNKNETPQKTLSKKDSVAIKSVIYREESWYNQQEKEKINELFTKETRKRLLLYSENNGEIVETPYHYNRLNFEKKSNFEGWFCWAGIKHMKITPNGDIYVGSCHVGGRRGNIYEIEKGIDLPTEPLRCPKWRCTDNLDLRVPKVKGMKYYYLVAPSVEGNNYSSQTETTSSL